MQNRKWEAKGNKMGNRFSKIIWMVLVVAFIFTGCQRKYKEEAVHVLDSGPEIDMTSVPPDYVVKAIKAVGGLNAWTQTKELQLDCVVTFYQPDTVFI